MNFLQLLRKKKELIPLITFVSLAGFGATYMCIYSFFKPDVIFDRKKTDPWENVDPNQPQKLVTINQKWEAIEELQTVKKLTK